jgi:hypothetical protein
LLFETLLRGLFEVLNDNNLTRSLAPDINKQAINQEGRIKPDPMILYHHISPDAYIPLAPAFIYASHINQTALRLVVNAAHSHISFSARRFSGEKALNLPPYILYDGR